jgi:hypothetical protein
MVSGAAMSLELTAQEVATIWAEAEQHCPPATSIDRLETIYTVPSQLGCGYHRYLELLPGLELCIINRNFCEWTQRVSENEHLVQFAAYLSGSFDSGDFVRVDGEQSYVGRSFRPNRSQPTPQQNFTASS